MILFFFFQAEDGIRVGHVTGVQTCALPISPRSRRRRRKGARRSSDAVTWPTIVKPATNRTVAQNLDDYARVRAAFSWAGARADLASLKRDMDLREQLDLDSMDLLNFVVGLHAALGVEIPEADYPKL